jgi:sulfur-carrier protein
VKIVVKPYLFVRDVLGFTDREIELPAEGKGRVEELVSILRVDYKLPDWVDIPQGRLILFDGSRPVGLVILINGRNINKLQGLNTLLKEGDLVTLFPPTAGG